MKLQQTMQRFVTNEKLFNFLLTSTLCLLYFAKLLTKSYRVTNIA